MPALRTVLCVDDDEMMRVMLQFALESVGGLTVHVCASGEDALETAPSASPDLFVLDMFMDDMDGPDLLERLRALPHLAEIPVVFLTAATEAETAERCRRLGAIDVIGKPIEPMDLAESLRSSYERWVSSRSEDEGKPPTSAEGKEQLDSEQRVGRLMS